MAQYVVFIVSNLIGDGTPDTNPFRPAFADEHPEMDWAVSADDPAPAGQVTLAVKSDHPVIAGYEAIRVEEIEEMGI